MNIGRWKRSFRAVFTEPSVEVLGLASVVAALATLCWLATPSGADVTNDDIATAASLVQRQLDQLETAEKSGHDGMRSKRIRALKDTREKLENCGRVPFQPSKNPDSTSRISRGTAMLGIMDSGGFGTNRVSNTGERDYMRKSVASDCRFYRASVIFYSRLKELDLSNRPAFNSWAGASIRETSSQNLLEIARSAVRSALGSDNDFLAFKVMALFGHDNQNNGLTELPFLPPFRCEQVVLDAMKPMPNSNLYLNNAIPPKWYTTEDVNQGAAIARECRAATAGSGHWHEFVLCNEGQGEYQSDYYHVVNSAFLNCAGFVQVARAGSPATSVESASGSAIDSTYLSQIRGYKVDRFQEEINEQYKANPKSIPIRLVKLAAAQFGVGAHVTNEQLESLCNSQGIACSLSDYRITLAILARHEFEVGFRARQHTKGIELARQFCSGNTFNYQTCSQ